MHAHHPPACLALLISALALTASAAGDGAGGAAADWTPLVPKSLVATGDTARLRQVFAKARGGGKITVAVIGGSITQGAKASAPDKQYGGRLAAWWRAAFPQARIAFVNAGIGATGSTFAALRARRDLLSHQPDFVVVEFAVNDGPTRDHAESLEGLVRQILGLPNHPAVVLLFMMNNRGGNAQEWQAKVGAHYALPMVSYRDALWPEIQAGRLTWATISPDEVHPNDLGHELAARFVTALIDDVLARLPAEAASPAVPPLPPPLFSDLFEHTVLGEATDLKPARSEGWTLDPKTASWHSVQPGSVVEFEIAGRTILLMSFRLRGAMGQAKAQVDDAPPKVLDAWFSGTWGGYRETTILARDLKPGPHRVRIELLEAKNPGSTGHEFRVLALGAAGADAANP